MQSVKTISLPIQLEQIARVLSHLNSKQIEELEDLLDADTKTQVVRRARDGRKKAISHSALVKSLS